jgi:hypothetical protein
MDIKLNKFGTTLTSRQSGREAFSAFKSTLDTITDSENIEVDFEGVVTFSPSWGDEFIGALFDKYGDKLTLKNTNNPSVKMTLQLLEQIHHHQFNIK